MRLIGKPLAVVNGACLARFVDTQPHSRRYAHGLLWVGVDGERITWTEGVRLAEGSDAVDVENLWPEMRALYEATQAAILAGGRLPEIV